MAVNDLPAKVVTMGNGFLTGLIRACGAKVLFEGYATLVVGDVNVE